MAANPDPARISDALWWFWEQLLAMEPDTQLGGIFANKAGYHNTRNNLLARSEWRSDYSIRLPADQRGPADKAAALDWTFPEAHGGDYRRITLYHGRIRDAFNRRDPRLGGWREALGQSDADLSAEGYDFVSWTTRTPDPSHLWHIHFSVLREFLGSAAKMVGMLLVLGWTPPQEEDMPVAYKIQSSDTNYNNRYYLSNGVHRRGPIRQKSNILTPALGPSGKDGAILLTDAMRQSVDAAMTWEQYLDAVAGPEPGAVAAAAPHTHEATVTVEPAG